MKIETHINRILNSEASDSLKLGRLQTLALRCCPSSGEQRQVQAHIKRFQDAGVKVWTPPSKNEGVTPARRVLNEARRGDYRLGKGGGHKQVGPFIAGQKVRMPDWPDQFGRREVPLGTGTVLPSPNKKHVLVKHDDTGSEHLFLLSDVIHAMKIL